MPAAVSENTPQDDFGLNLANRRCSERRNVSRSLLTAVGKEAGEAELRRSGTSRRNDKASRAVTEPPGGRRRPQGLNRPPDGTGHRQGGRVMKAGSDEPPDKPSRPQPDPQGDGKASDDKPGTGDRPKSCGCTAGVLGADSNVGPICVWGVGSLTISRV